MCLYTHNFLLFIFLFITISAFQAITLWAIIIGNFLHSLKKKSTMQATESGKSTNYCKKKTLSKE